jgi:hypothetical protein
MGAGAGERQTSWPLEPVDDLLSHLPSGAVTEQHRWFDRFYFNLHSPDGNRVLILGGAVYPGARVVDGYCCTASRDEHLSVRFADQMPSSRADTSHIGPLQYEIVEPLQAWHLQLRDSGSPVELDLVARARMDAFMVDPISVDHETGSKTHFQHFFQPMVYDGELMIDGDAFRVSGWLGQRDRSWGIRRTRERLGLHLWTSLHFPSGTVAFNYNETRSHTVSHADGAFLAPGEPPARIADLEHDLELSDDRTRIHAGRLRLVMDDGRLLKLEVEPDGAAFELAGAGYDGRHGTSPAGRELEVERWDLKDPRWAEELSFRVAGQRFVARLDGEAGEGIVELGVTRSPSYTYHSRKAQE